MDSLQGLLLDSHPNDKYENTLCKLQALSMLVYHPLEHYSWVGYEAPGSLPSGRVDWAMRSSCWMWLAWIGLQLLRYRHHWAQLERVKRSADAKKQDLADVASKQRDICWSVAVLLTDSVLGFHWALKGGIGLKEHHIGILGLFGALVGGWQRWKRL